MNPKLSIIAPLYNETSRLEAGISAIRTYIDTKDFPCEVLLVDDGSSDQTADMATRLIDGDSRFRTISYQPNQGKGRAVKVGMLEAKGEIRLFTDIDMSVPIELADEFIRLVDQGNDIVIGTRKTKQSNVLVHQPPYREILGEAYRKMVRTFFAPGITDFTCGFKAFSGQATEKIFPQSLIKRWSFDSEILFLAYKWGLKIHEIPVSWTNSPATKVSLIFDVARSGWELLLIQWNWFTGKYTKS